MWMIVSFYVERVLGWLAEALCKQDARQLGYTLSDADRVFAKAKQQLDLTREYVVLACSGCKKDVFQSWLAAGKIAVKDGAITPQLSWNMRDDASDVGCSLTQLFSTVEMSKQSLSAEIAPRATQANASNSATDADLTLYLPVEPTMEIPSLIENDFPFNHLQAGLENYICKNAPRAATASWHACAFQDPVVAGLCCWFFTRMSIEEVQMIQLQVSLPELLCEIPGLRLAPIRQPAAFHVLGLEASNRVSLLNGLWRVAQRRAVTAKIVAKPSTIAGGTPKRRLGDLMNEAQTQEKRARVKQLKEQIQAQQHYLNEMSAELNDLELDLM